MRTPTAHELPARHGADAASTGPANPPERVLYVVSLFPALSETFVVREIDALIEHGVDIRILSLKPAQEAMVQPGAAALLDRVLHPATRSRMMAAVCGEILRKPAPTLQFLAMLLRELWRQPTTFAKSLVAVFRALGRLDDIRAFDPQLLHAAWANYPATVAWFLSRLLDRPFSFTSRAHDVFAADQMMPRKLESAALAITITEHNVRFMSRWMPYPGAIPVRVIHSSLDPAQLPFVRSARLPCKLLSVGRLVPMKGFDVLLRALAELRARGVEFTCTVIGEGEERGRLESLSTSLGLDELVEFPGAMAQNEVIRHMSAATLMVLPCVVTPQGQSDGIPNVLTESMALGLPVISTHISGIPELIQDGVSGRLVTPGDATALAEVVQDLLGDPRRRQSLAEAGRRKVERDFNVRIEAGRLLEHFGSSCHA
ncbi:MAG: glycosyltransferase [Pseudomonadota bacterium]|nr:glycosyltransferase [Pseudomonadota bacterium]